MKNYKYFISIIAILIFSGIALFTLLFMKREIVKQSRFSNTKIIFFCGGNQNDPYARIIYHGAKAAEEEFGANIKYIWSAWDEKQMADQFKAAVASKPDGICMMGHPGLNVLKPLIEEAKNHNIIVTLLDTDLPELRNVYKSKGFGYTGGNTLKTGKTLARVGLRKYPQKENAVCVVLTLGLPVTGLIKQLPNISTMDTRTQRSASLVNEMLKNKMKVYAINIPQNIDGLPDSEEAFQFIKKIFTDIPKIDILAIDHGGLTSRIPSILKRMGKKPSDTIVLGFDLSKLTAKGIEEGYLDLVADEQPYLQGFFSVLQICLSKKYGFSGLYIDTGSSIVDKSNIKLIQRLAIEEIR